MLVRLFALAAVMAACLMLALSSVDPADASGCTVRRAVVVHNPIVVNHAAVVATPVAIATFVPVPLVVPAYGASYDHAGQQLAEVKTQLEAVKAQNAKLIELIQKKSLTPGEAPPAAPAPPAKESKAGTHPGALVMAKSCASCHEASVAKSKGAGLTLLTGSAVAPIADKTARSIVRELLKGTMPPNAKLSDDDVTQVLDLVSQ